MWPWWSRLEASVFPKRTFPPMWPWWSRLEASVFPERFSLMWPRWSSHTWPLPLFPPETTEAQRASSGLPEVTQRDCQTQSACCLGPRLCQVAVLSPPEAEHVQLPQRGPPGAHTRSCGQACGGDHLCPPAQPQPSSASPNPVFPSARSRTETPAGSPKCQSWEGRGGSEGRERCVGHQEGGRTRRRAPLIRTHL